MATCNKCGEEIEFRHISGRLTPIHINGGCGATLPREPFQDLSTYLTPNALCPICGKSVYFYQSPYGGRVFFDDLGWPWPKHPCTDDARSQSGRIKQIKGSTTDKDYTSDFFRDREGNVRPLYFLIRVEGSGDSYVFIFQSPVTEKYVWLKYSRVGLEKAGLRVQDLREAPSFVASTYDIRARQMQIDFISVRLKKVVMIRMKLIS